MAVFRATLPEIYEARQAQLFYQELDMEPMLYTQVANVESTTKAYFDWFEVSGLGQFRLKPEGTPISYDDPIQGTRRRVLVSTFGLGYRVTMEAMDDALYDVIDQHPKDLGNAGREHQEIFFWGMLNDSFAGVSNTTIDGLSICNTAHVILKPKDPTAATYSNQLSPAVALSVTGIESAITNMRLTKSREDRFTPLVPATLVIHPSLSHLAYQILDTQKAPFTNENQSNTVRTSRTGITAIDSPYLSDQESWWLLASKGKHKLTFINRMDLTFSSGRDSQTKDHLFDGMYRAAVVTKEWRGIVGSNV